MRVEVLTIGHELLDGRVVDSNTTRLATMLAQVGVHVVQRTTVLDDCEAIVAAATDVCSRGSNLCIVSGGLGPTADDLTATAFAQLTHVPLVVNPEIEQSLIIRYQNSSHGITPNQLRQAERPQHSELIANPVGSAPGFALRWGNCRFVVLPGVPREFDAMVQTSVIPWLMQQHQIHAIPRKLIFCFGLPEAEIDHRLAALSSYFPAVFVQYRACSPEVHVQMHVATVSQVAELEKAYSYALASLGDYAFSTNSRSLVEVVAVKLTERNLTLAVAESCTGGLIMHLLTDQMGMSRILLGGMVTYSPEAKIRDLQIPAEFIAKYGVVSAEVALKMATQVQTLYQADLGIGITGIAGPSGGSSDKPVGTIHIACTSAKAQLTKALNLSGDRKQNKIYSAYHALDTARRLLHEL